MDRYAITDGGQLIAADSRGHLPPNIPEVLGFAFTTAPEAYDYWYTHTVASGIEGRDRDGEWRLVAFTDAMRFENFQSPRYGSGLYPVFLATDDERRDLFELPAVETLLEGE